MYLNFKLKENICIRLCVKFYISVYFTANHTEKILILTVYLYVYVIGRFVYFDFFFISHFIVRQTSVKHSAERVRTFLLQRLFDRFVGVPRDFRTESQQRICRRMYGYYCHKSTTMTSTYYKNNTYGTCTGISPGSKRLERVGELFSVCSLN